MKPTPPCHPTHHHHHDTVITKHSMEWWWTNAISRLCIIKVGRIHAYSYICTCHALLSCQGSTLRRYLSPKATLEQMCKWQAFLRRPILAIKTPIAKNIYPQCGEKWLDPIAVCAPGAMGGGAIFSQRRGRKVPLRYSPKHPSWYPPEDQSVWSNVPPKKFESKCFVALNQVRSIISTGSPSVWIASYRDIMAGLLRMVRATIWENFS